MQRFFGLGFSSFQLLGTFTERDASFPRHCSATIKLGWEWLVLWFPQLGGSELDLESSLLCPVGARRDDFNCGGSELWLPPTCCETLSLFCVLPFCGSWLLSLAWLHSAADSSLETNGVGSVPDMTLILGFFWGSCLGSLSLNVSSASRLSVAFTLFSVRFGATPRLSLWAANCTVPSFWQPGDADSFWCAVGSLLAVPMYRDVQICVSSVGFAAQWY